MNPTLALAAAFGLILTIAGALGAHAIPVAASDLRATWDSALLFGFVHVLAAIAATLVAGERRLARFSAWAFLAGAVLFSLALLVATAARAASDGQAEMDWLSGVGATAPAGGLAFMLGWVLLLVSALRKRD